MSWMLRLLIARYGPRVARSMWARYQARRAVATGHAAGGFGAPTRPRFPRR